jgi:hypothetical protein
MAKTPTTTTAAETPKSQAKPRVIDDPSVKEVYADDFVGLFGVGPNFHLTFAARRPAPGGTGDQTRLVSSRLVLPLEAMLDMYGALQSAVTRLQSTGVIRARQPDEPKAGKGK